MLTEAKKKAAPKKGKSKESKPKVESAVQDMVDPNTGQPIEVTKPAKAMTGNPANPIIVYPNTGGQTSVVDPRNPMRNSQTSLIQSHTDKPGMLLTEYIDYARGKIIQGIGQTEIPKAPAQGDNGNEPMNPDHSGDLGTDSTDLNPAASVAAANADNEGAKFGDVNQRIRRRAGKRNSYHDGMPGIWGGDDADYVSENASWREHAVPAGGTKNFDIHEWGGGSYSIVLTHKAKKKTMWIPDDHVDSFNNYLDNHPSRSLDTALGDYWAGNQNRHHVRDLT